MYLIFVQRLRTIVQTVDILLELLGVLNLCTKVTDNCTICHSSLNTETRSVRPFYPNE